MTILQIIQKYPIKNKAWEASDSLLFTEMSDVSSGGSSVALDPWNRPLPSAGWEANRESSTEEVGDVIFWQVETTVGGQSVPLRIFND
jgi:hypothetical protein